MAVPTLEQVRRDYPRAGAVDSDAPYCIGGALLKALGLPKYGGFPSATQIAEGLQEMCPLVDADDYTSWFSHAKDIIFFNDEDKLDEAWDLVDVVLKKIAKMLLPKD